MLSFVKQLGIAPHSNYRDSIEWIQSIAKLVAHLGAVFEEFDDTYAQAFGVQPMRPTPNSMGMLDQPENLLLEWRRQWGRRGSRVIKTAGASTTLAYRKQRRLRRRTSICSRGGRISPDPCHQFPTGRHRLAPNPHSTMASSASPAKAKFGTQHGLEPHIAEERGYTATATTTHIGCRAFPVITGSRKQTPCSGLAIQNQSN
ncbi:hypothetical protein HPP92_026263 [Vanilla planifolia]|uniref:Uncharacterized protein n=1 Tax=Vanilla planifolia TaxID=51239 RepID=A0A835PH97_VANPL|nr:hypothetical protein HPP92_026263 [Vanilla planifolia]